jgi:hypothetical protein
MGVRNKKTVTTNKMEVTVFCDVGPCTLIDVNRRFRGAYCLRHQGIASETSVRICEKTATFTLVAVRI